MILDIDERRSDYYGLLAAESKSRLWRLISRIEKPRMRRAEVQAMDRYETVIVSSPDDRVKLPDTTLVRSPTLQAISSQSSLVARKGYRHGVVFVGRLSYYANIEAIEWFALRVWPLVRAREPEAILTIVGEDPPESLKRLADESIVVTGRVERVAPYYQSALVSVVPVEYATGAQMKLIESMQLGAASIITPRVATGMGLLNGTHALVIERDPAAWATAVFSLLRDHRKTDQLRMAAAHWVKENYSDDAILSSISRIVDRNQP
ncbi:glycosyltransferase family 4 protein [Plantibacter sp. CFBP 13570]|uniref:glycosyltransferase family 4 protein n=1 Tax=Plantibacter sp. CFBP 13570 TaxID=2775272 RepID=UPI001930A136|nr:glycosyltransferase family 4 protein [Plantibacter sp. CFBP 13570]MBD8535933.1 glycosyltransferase [Plantibacter sp. CFBP 13570]